MDVSELNNTQDESYGMAYSLARETLKGLMLVEDDWIKLSAAEAVLDNPPQSKKDEKKEDERDSHRDE